MAVTPKGDSQWLMPLYNPFPLSMEPVTCFWPTVYGKGDGMSLPWPGYII